MFVCAPNRRALKWLLILALLWPSLTMAEPLVTKHFRFITDEPGLVIANELKAHAERDLRAISATLGIRDQPQAPIEVRILRGTDRFQDAVPGPHPPAEWTAGLAMPYRSLILLKVDAQTRFSIHDIFRHEVSHIVLHRAAGGNRLPLWFVEGVAVNQAGERLRERWAQTVESMLGDGPMPLEALRDGFPRGTRQVENAYAQSSAFVHFLIRRWGWNLLRYVIAQVRQGHAFAPTLERVTGKSLRQLEEAWLLEMEREASWLPLLTGEPLMWVLISLLFVASFFIHRSRQKAQLEAMDDGPRDDDEFA